MESPWLSKAFCQEAARTGLVKPVVAETCGPGRSPPRARSWHGVHPNPDSGKGRQIVAWLSVCSIPFLHWFC